MRILLLTCLVLVTRQEPRELGSATVGMPVSVHDLVLPGGELEVVPPTDATSVIVRLDAVRPHGEHHRYDLVWYGLDPGQYDLADFLRRKDGSEASTLPPLPLEVRSLLAPGQIQPHRPAEGDLPALGGYRWWLGAGALVWLIVLGLLLRSKKRARARASIVAPRAPSSAARLRELVSAAQAGALSAEGRAELELALIALWKRRLGLLELEATTALARLHEHPEAGPLLRTLEDWLHRPEEHAFDLEALLAPYARLVDEQPAVEAT